LINFKNWDDDECIRCHGFNLFGDKPEDDGICASCRGEDE